MWNESVFGAVQIGYIVFESNKLDDWRRFLRQGLGLHLESAGDDALAFRMDDHARRIMIAQGAAEDCVALGVQLRDQRTLDVVLARLAERRIAVEAGTEALAQARGVRSFVRVVGPKALPLELYTQPLHGDEPLDMLASGFATGDGGLGHVAITTRMPAKVRRFWQEIFDARISDSVTAPIAGVTLDVTFLRLNERHHSVAIAATRGLPLDPIRTKIQHLNLVAASLDDVSGAFERLRDLGFEMAHEIGQHPNDKEISFYAISPSGIEIELGWNPIVVDESNWTPATYGAISTWGHKPQRSSTLHQLRVNVRNFARGIRSLVASEFSPL